MILILTILIIPISIAVCIVLDKKTKCYCDDFLGGIIVLTGIALFFELLIMVVVYINAPANKAEKQETYKSLIYKAETESIRDDFGIVNKDYIDEVQAWNENVAFWQATTHNIWIGVFIPNFYDDFECIDLETIQMRE